MSELLIELSKNRAYNRLIGKSSRQIQEAFFANYLAGMLFVRLKDLPTLRVLRTTKERMPAHLSEKMNEIDYWCKCVFDSKKDTKMKSFVGPDIFKSIHIKMADSMGDRVHELLKTIKKDQDLIDWRRTSHILELLSTNLFYKSSYIDKILPVLTEWTTQDENKKSHAIGLCFSYLMQVDQSSKMLERLRTISNKLILSTGKLKFTGITRLTEEGEMTSAGNIGSVSSAIGNTILTRLKSINNLDSAPKISDSTGGKIKFRKLGNKIIKKKKKSFSLKIFKNPTDAKK